jgi:hypothetical protein
MSMIKLPKTVAIYGANGKLYRGEVPEHLVDSKKLKTAIDKAIKQAEANRARHAKYAGHAESDALIKQFDAEIADLKGEAPPAPPQTPADPPQGDKDKGKGTKSKGSK